MLEAIGIAEDEERIYFAILDLRGASLTRLARVAGMSLPRARKAIQGLEKKGLVTLGPGKASRYSPSPPEVAIQSLLVRREGELDRVRSVAPELAKRFREASVAQEEPVQVISDVDAVVQTFLQLQRGARKQIVLFDKPPYAMSSTECNPVELEGLERGVRYRVLYDEESLETPGQVDTLETLMRSGEESRTLAHVPMKLVIADGDVGMLPLGSGQSGIESVLLVRPSALLDALNQLFEELWERAHPIQLPGGRPTEAALDGESLEADDIRILGLLGAGMQDEPIARQLKVSRRTVERRVARLMTTLDARTRFQAALRARDKGWL